MNHLFLNSGVSITKSEATRIAANLINLGFLGARMNEANIALFIICTAAYEQRLTGHWIDPLQIIAYYAKWTHQSEGKVINQLLAAARDCDVHLSLSAVIDYAVGAVFRRV